MMLLVIRLPAGPAPPQYPGERKQHHYQDRKSQEREIETPEDKINPLIWKKRGSMWRTRPGARRCLRNHL
jgi:hypothetical protein